MCIRMAPPQAPKLVGLEARRTFKAYHWHATIVVKPFPHRFRAAGLFTQQPQGRFLLLQLPQRSQVVPVCASAALLDVSMPVSRCTGVNTGSTPI